MIIGNFRLYAQTSYKIVDSTALYDNYPYYINDVSLIPLDSLPLQADAGRDNTIALGDSVFISSLTNGLNNITWYSSSGTVINTIASGFYVSPTISTFYLWS